MDPIQRFGGGGETYVHPVVAAAMLVSLLLILSLPRRYVIVPLLVTTFLIPMDQVIIIGPLHFQMLRMLILFGWIRLITAKLVSHMGFLSGGMNALDKAMILYASFSAVNFVLLWQQWGAVINQLGSLYTILGSYLLLRFLIRNDEDAVRAIKVLSYVSVVIAAIMLIEHTTGRNPYVFVGGAGEAVRESLMQRGARFRAMASFGHPILAGTFGAITLPLFVGLWCKAGNRVSASLGVVAATVITLVSVSSTPAVAFVGSIGALCLWPLRRTMRLIRWGLVLSLLSLHVVMKAPVWALIGRMDVVGGSSGWHRYYLVDQFIRRFGDWWLLGTKDYANWGWTMWDVANQYVAIGQSSGLLPFIFFLVVIVYGFKYLGRARKAAQGHWRSEAFLWALGVALFSNVVAFFGISYFDQTMIAWYALLAIIPVAAAVPARTTVVSPTKNLEQHVSQEKTQRGQQVWPTSMVELRGHTRPFSDFKYRRM